MKRLAVANAFALVVAACGGDDEATDPDGSSVEESSTTSTVAPDDATTTMSAPGPELDERGFAGTIDLEVEDADRCEIIGNHCALPFPSDALTVDDPSAPTGRRVAIARESMPATVEGSHIDTARQNRNDGFSPGAAGLVLFPGVDPVGSNLPPVTDIGRSLDADSGSVVVDATTGELWPHWSEVDSNAPSDDNRGLFVRPAVNYPNGHRIVIGLRSLVDGDGEPIEPTDENDRMENADATERSDR